MRYRISATTEAPVLGRVPMEAMLGTWETPTWEPWDEQRLRNLVGYLMDIPQLRDAAYISIVQVE